MKDREAALSELFRAWDGRDRPGCAVAVVEDGRLTTSHGFGMANLEHDVPIAPTTVFHVASIAKQFTAFLCVLLAREGKLALTHDVRSYLPELPAYDRAITLRHLLHHTSGLRDQWTLLNLAGWREHDVVTNADVLDLARRQRALDFPIGDEYQYCNTGYTLLGLIVARVSGQPLRVVAQERIFGPLGMTRTHFHDDHQAIVPNRASAYVPGPDGSYRISVPAFDTVGATSLFTTVEDLALWVSRWLDPKPDDEAVNALMIAPGTLNDGTTLPYAAGLEVTRYRGLPTVGHSGGDAGYRAHLMWFPEQRFGAIVLGNASSLPPGALARKIADVYLADQLAALPPPSAPLTVADAEPSTRAGLYWNARLGKIRRIEWQDGALRVPIWPGYSPQLRPLAADHFAVDGEPVELRFRQNAAGTVDLLDVTEGMPTEVYAPVVGNAPTADQLRAYVGTYRSDEIVATWEVRLQEKGLVLRRFKSEDTALVPAFADGFLLSGWDPIVFHRDDGGQVDGFAFSTYRLRHLVFRGVP